MAVSQLMLIKHYVEFVHKDNVESVPRRIRGLYVLFRYRPRLDKYDVVYIGMAAGTKTASVRGRLRVHRRRKAKLWTHFSVFEAWDNIREEDIQELEGLFRHIYRKDTRANRLNRQRGFKKLYKVAHDTRNEGCLKTDTPRRKRKK